MRILSCGMAGQSLVTGGSTLRPQTLMSAFLWIAQVEFEDDIGDLLRKPRVHALGLDIRPPVLTLTAPGGRPASAAQICMTEIGTVKFSVHSTTGHVAFPQSSQRISFHCSIRLCGALMVLGMST